MLLSFLLILIISFTYSEVFKPLEAQVTCSGTLLKIAVNNLSSENSFYFMSLISYHKKSWLWGSQQSKWLRTIFHHLVGEKGQTNHFDVGVQKRAKSALQKIKITVHVLQGQSKNTTNKTNWSTLSTDSDQNYSVLRTRKQ